MLPQLGYSSDAKTTLGLVLGYLRDTSYKVSSKSGGVTIYFLSPLKGTMIRSNKNDNKYKL